MANFFKLNSFIFFFFLNLFLHFLLNNRVQTATQRIKLEIGARPYAVIASMANVLVPIDVNVILGTSVPLVTLVS